MTDQRTLQNGSAATRLGEGNEGNLHSQLMSGALSPLPYLPLPPANKAQDLASNLFRKYGENLYTWNAHEIYQRRYIEYLESQGIQTDGIAEADLSTIIQSSWSKESTKVKDFYLTVERLCSPTSFESVMSPNSDELPPPTYFQEETGSDFCLFYTNNHQTTIGPPTPMSVTASPFDSFNYRSEHDGGEKLFFPSLSDIQRKPTHSEDFSEENADYGFSLF